MASAITSRETSEYFMPSVPIEMPSVTVMVPNICGIAPAARAAASAASASGWMPALHGFMVEWPFAMPTIGLSKSASPYPMARSIERLGERGTPLVIVNERYLWVMAGGFWGGTKSYVCVAILRRPIGPWRRCTTYFRGGPIFIHSNCLKESP